MHASAKGARAPPTVGDGWLGVAGLEAGQAGGGAEADIDPWKALGIRLAVLLQFGCFLYILNTHGVSSTLCQGPSM
eukprot:SAG22_NODE_880_length_6703_cov_8.753786_3_plen_76_part_00